MPFTLWGHVSLETWRQYNTHHEYHRQCNVMERATVKVVPTFRDFLKHIVSDPDFPIKSVHQLITLTSIKWIENYRKASKKEKLLMIEELKSIQAQAEESNFLHNSREMRNDEQQ